MNVFFIVCLSIAAFKVPLDLSLSDLNFSSLAITFRVG